MNKQRLLKLADFLEKLPPEKFNYATIVSGEKPPRKELDCGSTACALGWCPVVFPKHLTYRRSDSMWNDFEIGLKGARGRQESFSTAEKFFGLKESEVDGLFAPRGQYLIGYCALTEDATAKEVARLIRRFVAKNSKP